MAFIKAQKIVRDNSGKIISGSAAIVDTIYISTGEHNLTANNRFVKSLEGCYTSAMTKKREFSSHQPVV